MFERILKEKKIQSGGNEWFIEYGRYLLKKGMIEKAREIGYKLAPFDKSLSQTILHESTFDWKLIEHRKYLK